MGAHYTTLTSEVLFLPVTACAVLLCSIYYTTGQSALPLNWIHSKIISEAIIGLTKTTKIEFHPLDWIYRSIQMCNNELGLNYAVTIININVSLLARVPYSGKISQVQIFAKTPFPLQKKFSRLARSLTTPLYRRRAYRGRKLSRGEGRTSCGGLKIAL